MSRTTHLIAIIVVAACSKPQAITHSALLDADMPDTLKKTEGSIARPRYRSPDDVREYHQGQWDRFNKVVASFKISDGIDCTEAEFLGEAYFSWKLDGCSFAGPAKAIGSEWRMRPRVGLR